MAKARIRCILVFLGMADALAACLVPPAPPNRPPLDDDARGLGTNAGTTTNISTANSASAPSPEQIDSRKGLSSEQIRNVVKTNLSPLRGCYESEVEHNPNLKGRISVKWVIAPN